MWSEKDKMLGGERYDPLDPQLAAERPRARLLFKALNDTRDDQPDERARLIRALIPAVRPGHLDRAPVLLRLREPHDASIHATWWQRERWRHGGVV
jgi:Maltose acetyltransferase hexapeptide capping motif